MHYGASRKGLQYKHFGIIEEFSKLSPRRKVMLCEHLFSDTPSIFEKSVSTFWPEAQARDIKKLKSFLVLLHKAAHLNK